MRALIASWGISDPSEIMRLRAAEVIQLARSRGWSGPPFNPEILASILGIQCRPSTQLFSAEAQLSPQPNRQLLLEFNPDRPDGRKNYSICHEIAHTFFDDCFERVHHRSSGNPPQFGPEDELEQLCQIAAAELLMPTKEFSDDLLTRPFSLATMLELRTRYAASREAVLRRMIHLGDEPGAAVFFNRRHSPKEQREPAARRAKMPEKMRIVYSVRSSEFPDFLPDHKSVPDTSCVARALLEDGVVSAVETWIDGCGAWQVEAVSLNTPADAGEKTPTVAALVLADWL